MTWPSYYFSLIQTIKQKSKDPHTKVGCLIVGSGREILSTGYNSFPRQLQDNVEERSKRPEKYFWIEHAERNAIYNAARAGIRLEEAEIWMQGLPCPDCARAIIQSGIKKIHIDWEEWLKWTSPTYTSDLTNRSIDMLRECGVKIIAYTLSESEEGVEWF